MEKICPFMYAAKLIVEGIRPEPKKVIIKCLGKDCAVWSGATEGCGLSGPELGTVGPPFNV